MAKSAHWICCVFGLVVWLWTSPAWTEEDSVFKNGDDNYCSVVQKFQQGFAEDFKTLKDTFYDAGQDLKVWSLKETLPEAKRCDIWQTDTERYVACEIFQSPDYSESRKVYQKNIQRFQHCLTKQWVSKEEGLLSKNPGEHRQFEAHHPQVGAKITLDLKKGSEENHSVEFKFSIKPPATDKKPKE